MANRVSNLDPALSGLGEARQYPTEDPNAKLHVGHALQSESYRPDASQPAPAYSASQPYYQYSGSAAQDVIAGSTNAPVQQSPDFTSQDPAQQQSPQDGADALGAAEDAKRQRACEACRGLKVRCDQDPAQPDVPCKRCAKAGRPCVITQPSRKRQKKADTRVAELEKKLDALTAALEHRHSTGNIMSTSQMPGGVENPVISLQAPTEPLRHAKTHESTYDSRDPKRRRIGQLDDDIARHAGMPKMPRIGLLAQEPSEMKTSLYDMSIDDLRAKINALIPFSQSADLFKRYNESMSLYFSVVVFPHGTSAEHVFQDKPILYLAIITAASATMNSQELSMKLQQESISAIADCVIKNGAKSLELIQAMLIMAGWYKPPERAEQTTFYQIIHMAAVVALDIGLGRRYNARKTRTHFGKGEVAFAKIMTQNSDSLDARRAWLGCYYLCATSSMVLRRPNLVRWTEYMKECIDVLETSPDAHSSDKLLCQHIRIQHICEDIGLQFLMDDYTAQVSINDPKVTYALVTLENQLKSWKQQVPKEAQCASLTFFEHVTSLYLHEIALHFNHNIEDFRLPFTEESLKNVDNSSDALTQNQITAIEACLKAAHGILDTMISFTPDELLALPLILFFVRCIYALVILLKMYVAISTPGSELGKLMKSADLKVEYYLGAIIDNFSEVVTLTSNKPVKALKILQLLREWFEKHKEGLTNKQDDTGSATTQDDSNFTQRYGQTPLDMLSQVATGQQGGNASAQSNAAWTFNPPDVFDNKRSQGDEATSRFAYQLPQSNMAYNAATLYNDTQPQDYGWGSGFEQAMDMTLGHMGDLQGGALDSWFLGENAAPFTFMD